MEPTPASLAAFHAALPTDPRVETKKMFGSPCAFVNRQMFFGTFGDTLVARVGPGRAATLAAEPGRRVFAPGPDRTWPDYVQLDATADAEVLRGLAAEALTWADALPSRRESRADRKARSKR
jgi:hypothetical protein